MMFRIVLALLLLAACSPVPDVKISKTVEVSAERLAEIRSNPYVKRYKRGSDPSARLGGLEGDPWPAGVMFLSEVMDPYLEDLGLKPGITIAAINGKKAHEIFVERWQKKRGRRPAGFTNDHYKDLISYLFLENKWNQFVMTVYLDVPSSSDEIRSYVPKIENWRIKFK